LLARVVRICDVIVPGNLRATAVDQLVKSMDFPIVGTANCGPATIFAEENFQGFLRVSSKLIGRSKPTGLYAIKADGSSMNRAEVNGKRIEDGDLVIIDKESQNPSTGDVILAIHWPRGAIRAISRR